MPDSSKTVAPAVEAPASSAVKQAAPAFSQSEPASSKKKDSGGAPVPTQSVPAKSGDQVAADPVAADASGSGERKYLLERIDDVGIAQLYADGFERLALREKTLVWHLYQAALAGRDIYMQQKCKNGPAIRELFEEILVHSDGVDPKTLENVRHYAKLFWIDNSPYNAYTSRKNLMQGDAAELVRAAESAEKAGAHFSKCEGESAKDVVTRLAPTLFDPAYKPMGTAKNPEGGQDILQASAPTYFGEGVALKDLESFQEKYELNSNIVKKDGKLEEQVWRAGDPKAGIAPGLYAKEIANIIGHLEAALPFAPDATRKALEALIRFYRTGERADRVAYDIAWVADKDSTVDTVNGFIEVYVDPRGKKGGWEGIVSYEDPKKAGLIKKIADNAQWFEDHMPYDERFRKGEVKGISARSIDVVIETGDSGPVTPIGINLPNDQEIREKYGSKSVSLANVIEATEKSSTPAARAEFCFTDAEAKRAEKWSALTGDLLTNMHEGIGHASGRQASDKPGDPANYIKEYYSSLEEARADLVALYFMMDPKLQELGLLENPGEAALAAYEQYTRNGGLQQLRRVKQGDQLEEDHMRNRQLVVRWMMANTKAIEQRVRGGKHYLVVVDAAAWRKGAGKLLSDLQLIKSEGDYDGALELFDTYGVKFDPKLRDEVLARYSKLDVPAYTGFVMPRLTAVTGLGGEITDVQISYPSSIEQQMLEWSGRRAPPH